MFKLVLTHDIVKNTKIAKRIQKHPLIDYVTPGWMVLRPKEWFSMPLKPLWDQQEHVQYGNALHALCAYCVLLQVRCLPNYSDYY